MSALILLIKQSRQPAAELCSGEPLLVTSLARPGPVSPLLLNPRPPHCTLTQIQSINFICRPAVKSREIHVTINFWISKYLQPTTQIKAYGTPVPEYLSVTSLSVRSTLVQGDQATIILLLINCSCKNCDHKTCSHISNRRPAAKQ